jgi:hypothetical protein
MCDATTPQVQAWRGLFEQYASDLPTGVLLNWIAVESCGNPCSMPQSTIVSMGGEIGIAQLDLGNRVQAGVTAEALRAACAGSSEQLARPLTDDERLVQVTSTRTYANVLRAQTHQALQGLSWDDESTADFWAMMKMIHTVGAGNSINRIPQATQILGHPPSSWAEFRSAIEPTGAVASKWFNLAEGVGQGGAGFQAPLFAAPSSNQLWAIAGIGLLAGALASLHRLFKTAR